MYSYQLDDETLTFNTAQGVFEPTATSALLIDGFLREVREPGKLLDLGCGVGLVGIVLAKLGLVAPPVYASDVSPEAVACAQHNAERHSCGMVARVGSLFEPWRDETFDYIVDDVSGVAEDLAAISPWFTAGVPCASGRDGTALISRVISEAPSHLNPGGLFVFPVLSLSNTDKIIELAKETFGQVRVLAHQHWYLPKEVAQHADLLRQLQSEGLIRIEEKFGMLLWCTEIYVAAR